MAPREVTQASAPAAQAASTTTVYETTAVGEIHYCKGITLTAYDGSYTMTKTATDQADGSIRYTGDSVVSATVKYHGSDGKTYTMGNLARNSWFDYTVSGTVVTGTVSNSWKYDQSNGSGLGTEKQTTTFKADGSQSNKYGGSCGQQPVV